MIGAWDLAAYGRDGSGQGVHAASRGGVEFGVKPDAAFGRRVARFRGAGRLEVVPPAGLGARDITVAAWVNAVADPTTALGDVVSWFDPETRHGFTLGFEHGSSCGSHGNDRTAWFGVDAIALTKAGIVVPARSTSGGGGVFRYDGDGHWTSRGLQPDTTQVYSIETYGGRMHVGTWPTGLVLRATNLDSPGAADWDPIGRLGAETEVMNLQTYNGMLYAGTLPHAQIHRHDGDDDWALVGTLDETPSVRYRRAASMAVFRGELFVGTLPSAHVFSLRTGAVATCDRSLSAEWHPRGRPKRQPCHAVRGRCRRRGKCEGRPRRFVRTRANVPLVLGGGPRAGFEGDLATVRLWDRAPDPDEVRGLAG